MVKPTTEGKTVSDPYAMAERMRAFAKEKGLDIKPFEMQYATALNLRKMNNETFSKMSMANYNRSIENLMRSKGMEPPK